MKYIFRFLLLGTVIFSCSSGGSSDDGPDVRPNSAPTAPSLVSPSNNLLCVENTLTFNWNASVDADGDTITYKIEIATDNLFNNIVHFGSTTTTSFQVTLSKGTAYYWHVFATDSNNASSDYSSVFQLYTENEGLSNHLPFAPGLISPSNGETVTGGVITLQWEASDVDQDDLVYDIYFDSIDPPVTLVSEDQTESSFEFSLSTTGTYFWKVVVKDENGGETIGQVWYFNK
jgi:SusE outer membrane protein